MDLTRPASRLLIAIALALVGAGALVVAVGVQVIRIQARIARRAIGKPLGEDAHMADKTYKKKYGASVELLLLGDSIAAGLGADKPKHTLGAQLANRVAKATHRSVRLHTAAQVGSETSMLRAQLVGLPPRYRPHVAIVVVGGNDVTHRVKTSESTRYLREAIETLTQQGAAVVVGTCPDLGALAALPQPLRKWAHIGSRQLANAQRELTLGLGGRVVSLADVVGPVFVSQPEEMFAVDRFHPSSAGYRRTAKAIVPRVLDALGYEQELPSGHYWHTADDSARTGRDVVTKARR